MARRSQTVEVSRLVGGWDWWLNWVFEPLVLEGELETPEHHQVTNSNQGSGCYGEAHLIFIKFNKVVMGMGTSLCHGLVCFHDRRVLFWLWLSLGPKEPPQADGTPGVGFKGTLKGKPLCLGRSRKRRHTHLPAGSS